MLRQPVKRLERNVPTVPIDDDGAVRETSRTKTVRRFCSVIFSPVDDLKFRSLLETVNADLGAPTG